MTAAVIIHAGRHMVELPDSHHIAHIDTTDLTLDQLRRLDRALTEAGDPAGINVPVVELHPIVGEYARAIVAINCDDGITRLREVNA